MSEEGDQKHPTEWENYDRVRALVEEWLNANMKELKAGEVLCLKLGSIGDECMAVKVLQKMGIAYRMRKDGLFVGKRRVDIPERPTQKVSEMSRVETEVKVWLVAHPVSDQPVRMQLEIITDECVAMLVLARLGIPFQFRRDGLFVERKKAE